MTLDLLHSWHGVKKIMHCNVIKWIIKCTPVSRSYSDLVGTYMGRLYIQQLMTEANVLSYFNLLKLHSLWMRLEYELNKWELG